MRIYHFLLCFKLMLLLSFSSAYAGDTGTAIPKTQFVASFSLGPGWYEAGRTQTLWLQPGFMNTYVAGHNSDALITGELFLGGARQLHQRLWGQLGIAGSLASPARLSGVIWETGDSHLDNFTYAYHIDHAQVSLKGKILTLLEETWYPYLSASVGAGFNSSNHYTSTPLLFEIISISPFANQTITSFAYTAGVGIQKAIDGHWQLGIGYEFADWGQSQLGAIPGTEMSHGPGLNHLYVNQLMLNITFLT